jgi:hypothetical protein
MQLSLMQEAIEDAIKEVARVVGGTKVLAGALWPTKANSHTHFLDCLNPERPAKLSPSELMVVAKIGRERDCHAVMQFLVQEIGYEMPKPADLEKSIDEISSRIADGMDFLRAEMPRLEKLIAQRAGK